jgi:hypothetical protein
MAVATDHETAPILLRPRNFRWCWSSATDPSSTSYGGQWQSYDDVDIEIIEDAFNGKKDTVEIDGAYVIDFKSMLRYNKLNLSQACPTKRVQLQTNRNHGRIREDIFSLPFAFTSLNSTKTSTPNDPESEPKRTDEYHYDYEVSEIHNQNKHVADIVDDAARGIIEQGTAMGAEIKAKWFADKLLEVKRFGDGWIATLEWRTEIPPEIGYTCVLIYTMESFWYRILNAVMRDPKKRTRENMEAFGPFSFLLNNYLHQHKTYTISTVFRGVNLTTFERLKFVTGIQFASFTSTSRSRAVAEFRGSNTLLIIDLNIKERDGVDVGRSGAHIAHLSEYSEEDEFLIWPRTLFHFIRREYDAEKNKHIIHLRAAQTNC